MLKIRTVKPKMLESMGRQGVPIEARYFMVGLLMLADDRGRFEWKPKMINGVIYPEDDEITVEDVCGYLDVLAQREIIKCYEVAGVKYGVFVNWTTHQYISKPSKSHNPAPPTGCLPESDREVTGELQVDDRENTGSEEGRRKKEDISIGGSELVTFVDELLSEMKSTYPPRKGNQNWPVARNKLVQIVRSTKDVISLKENILRGCKLYHDSLGDKVGTEYVKQAATWVNQRGWEDDYNPVKVPQTQKAFRVKVGT